MEKDFSSLVLSLSNKFMKSPEDHWFMYQVGSYIEQLEEQLDLLTASGRYNMTFVSKAKCIIKTHIIDVILSPHCLNTRSFRNITSKCQVVNVNYYDLDEYGIDKAMKTLDSIMPPRSIMNMLRAEFRIPNVNYKERERMSYRNRHKINYNRY